MPGTKAEVGTVATAAGLVWSELVTVGVGVFAIFW